MSVYAVSYDLRKPGRNYDDLHTAIRRYGYTHCLESSWFIETTQNAGTIRDTLKQHLDSNDQLVVTRLSGNWAAARTDHCTAWLKKRFP